MVPRDRVVTIVASKELTFGDMCLGLKAWCSNDGSIHQIRKRHVTIMIMVLESEVNYVVK